MLYDLVLMLAGLALLVLAGDALVRGAVALALKLGIPALIVSLTVVAFGTSAPEMLVAVDSALEGVPGIAFGNVVGSNIANVLLVLGIPALIAGIDMTGNNYRSYIVMLGVSVAFVALCFGGTFGPAQGMLLLAGLAVVITDAIRFSRNADDVVPDLDVSSPDQSTRSVTLYLLAGAIGLPLGAHLLVEGAVAIARDLGVGETLIGLTIVAVGTSLPELATSTMAAIRREAGVVIGNVLGSNIFNVLAIMGVASLFGPLNVPEQLLAFDLWVMLGAAAVLFPFVIGQRTIGRSWGIAFVAAYGFYVLSLIL